MRTIFSVVGIFLVGALAALGAFGQSISGAATYSCDFEGNHCDFLEQSKLGEWAPPAAPRRSTLVTTARSGSRGVRLHTEPGDSNVRGSGHWERDDLMKPPDPTYCNEGQEERASACARVATAEAMSTRGASTRPFRTRTGRSQTSPATPGTTSSSTCAGARATPASWSAGSTAASTKPIRGPLYTGMSCYLKLANYHAPFGQPSSIIFDRVVRGARAADVTPTPLEGTGATPTAPVAAAQFNFQGLWRQPSESGWGGTSRTRATSCSRRCSPMARTATGCGSNLARIGDRQYAGPIYRTTGPAWDAAPFDPSRVARVAVGTMTITFRDSGNGTLTYSVNGVNRTRPIIRYAFAEPASACTWMTGTQPS